MKTKKQLTRGLLKLLNINGVSGSTYNVQRYVLDRLDGIEGIKVAQDKYGNVIALLSNDEDGVGVTLGLNAHMDTVFAFGADRKIFRKTEGGEDIFFTNDKCLGADDRAGLEIVLSLMEEFGNKESELHKSFFGTLIAWITIDEETGCIGAEHLARESKLFEDLDMSITFDRRNERDIVWRNSWQEFCDPSYAQVFIKASRLQGMNYELATGSISDAVTSSENGVNSVNLSVGYNHEHSSEEMINLFAFYDTYKVARQFMYIINEEVANVKEFTPEPYKYYYDINSWDNEGTELSGNVSYDFSFDTVNITQKYHGEGRSYEDSVYVDTNDFLEIVAEYLVQNPSAYDELQRKITQKQVY
jgi:putative aminopeptidase FrvX